MERRDALKSLAITVAGVVFLPACNINSGSRKVYQPFLSFDQNKLLIQVIDTIIPSSAEIPGAKDLAVQDYISIMVKECHEPEIRRIFFDGLATIEKLADSLYKVNYENLEHSRKADVLLNLKDAKEKHLNDFYSLVKGLSIQGFMTSEYVMVNHSGYVMVPGPDYGDTAVPQHSKKIV
jgi:hypothetical protein